MWREAIAVQCENYTDTSINCKHFVLKAGSMSVVSTGPYIINVSDVLFRIVDDNVL